MKINVLYFFARGLDATLQAHIAVVTFTGVMITLCGPTMLWAQAAQVETINADASINSNAGADVNTNIKADSKTNRLGRLFFTAEQRALLDQQRRSGLISADPSISNGYSVDGLIHQKEGSGTAWINGYEVPLKSPTDSVHLPGLMNQSLKVGEVVDPKTGEAQDILPPGQSIRRGK